ALADLNSGLRIDYFAGDFVNQMLKVVAPSDLEKASFVGIRVYVEDHFLLQFGGVSLAPLGRAHKHGFLPIPACVDKGALGMPTLRSETAERLGLREQRDLT